MRGVAKWVSLLRRGKSPISLKREYFLRESHIFNNISEWYKLLLMIFLSEIALFLPHFRRKYCICEAKFSTMPYCMSQEDEKDLNRRQAVFAHHTKTTKGIHPILLTTYPPIENVYLRSVQKVITMEELFR